jgi:hypothetical protein
MNISRQQLIDDCLLQGSASVDMNDGNSGHVPPAAATQRKVVDTIPKFIPEHTLDKQNAISYSNNIYLILASYGEHIKWC